MNDDYNPDDDFGFDLNPSAEYGAMGGEQEDMSDFVFSDDGMFDLPPEVYHPDAYPSKATSAYDGTMGGDMDERPHGEDTMSQQKSGSEKLMRSACLTWLAIDGRWADMPPFKLQVGTDIKPNRVDVDALTTACEQRHNRSLEKPETGDASLFATEIGSPSWAYVLRRNEHGLLEWPLQDLNQITYKTTKPTPRPDHRLLTAIQTRKSAQQDDDSKMRPWDLICQALEARVQARLPRKSRAKGAVEGTRTVPRTLSAKTASIRKPSKGSFSAGSVSETKSKGRPQMADDPESEVATLWADITEAERRLPIWLGEVDWTRVRSSGSNVKRLRAIEREAVELARRQSQGLIQADRMGEGYVLMASDHGFLHTVRGSRDAPFSGHTEASEGV